MNNDCEILSYLYYSTHMRIKCLNSILKGDYSAAFIFMLASELRNSKLYKARAKNILSRYDVTTKDALAAVNQPQRYLTITDKLFAKDESGVAEMLIKNITAEVIGISKKLNENKCCSDEVKNLVDKILALENKAMDDLRKFL